MNETFCASHNADVDFDKIAKTINAINLRPRKGGTFTFQEVSEGDIFEIVKSLKSNSSAHFLLKLVLRNLLLQYWTLSILH